MKLSRVLLAIALVSSSLWAFYEDTSPGIEFYEDIQQGRLTIALAQDSQFLADANEFAILLGIVASHANNKQFREYQYLLSVDDSQKFKTCAQERNEAHLYIEKKKSSSVLFAKFTSNNNWQELETQAQRVFGPNKPFVCFVYKTSEEQPTKSCFDYLLQAIGVK